MVSRDVPSVPLPSSPRRCLGTTARGVSCRAWAMKGSDYCVGHRHRSSPEPGNHHPDPPRCKLETIDDLIDVMFDKLSILAAMIDEAEDTEGFLNLMNAYGRSAMHLAGLLRVKRSFGEPVDEVLDMLAQAAENLAREQGWAILLPEE